MTVSPFFQPPQFPNEEPEPGIPAHLDGLPVIITKPSRWTGRHVHELLYGYVRPCGRRVLVVQRDNDTTPSLGEVVDEHTVHIDGGVRDSFHQRMLAAAPGTIVRSGQHRVKMRKFTDAEFAAVDGFEFDLTADLKPSLRGEPGEPVSGPVHECTYCYYV
jgi:hypothetical protein